MHFFIPMKQIPTVTSQEKGINFDTRRVYEKPEIKEARAKYRAALMKYKPAIPIYGPVRLRIEWYFPAGNIHSPHQWKKTKPDTDNMIKLLKDVMTELGFWKDDAQVAWEESLKQYNDIPGIYIEVEELEV